MTTSVTQSLDQLCIDTIRTLSMDAVQKADSGHPGTPMALAPLAYVLFTRHLRHNPADPQWPNRDRFVLSAGHASMLLYSVLYLTGYDLTLDDLKQFRQWESQTPGHPEYGSPRRRDDDRPARPGHRQRRRDGGRRGAPGGVFNRRGHEVVDHHTYFIASDGDMMEGVSHEAASFAGHLRLGKLIGFYDDNHITIEGDTDLTFSDDAGARFEAYGWHVQHVADVNDLDALDAAIRGRAGRDGRPAIAHRRAHAHRLRQPEQARHRRGARLAARRGRGRAHQEGARLAVARAVLRPAPRRSRTGAKRRERGARAARRSGRSATTRTGRASGRARELERRLGGDLPDGWDAASPPSRPARPVASRAASGWCSTRSRRAVPELMGGVRRPRALHQDV